MSTDAVILLENVSKVFKRYHRPVDRLKEILLPGQSKAKEFWALKDINLEILKGETVGIIGRNGAGKSTLLQIIAGTLQPTTGDVSVNGRVAALLELGSGFNPEFTGHQNIFFNGRILGLTQAEIEDRYDQIVAFADIGDFIHQPVKTYSSGMFVRLAFAVQANIDASIVIIDEALAVGDVFFRQKCYSRLEQLRNAGASILLVSHSMPDIEQFCGKAILLENGKQMFDGVASKATKQYYLLRQKKDVKPFQKSLEGNRSSKYKTLNKSSKGQIPETFFQGLSDEKQITDGQANCIGIAISDTENSVRGSFRQGDILVLHYKFYINTNINSPICGAIITNSKGFHVHGKTNWQIDKKALLKSAHYGDVITCCQRIQLNLAPGDYTIEIGLSSILLGESEDLESISHKEFDSRRVRICHVPNAISFSVGLASDAKKTYLKHYGAADLPGNIELSILNSELN